jgi:hypothetical protein
MSRHRIAFTLGAASAAGLIGLTQAPVAGADPTDLDGFADLHGTATWTSAVDSLFVSLFGPTLAGELDTVGVDTFHSVDADPFSDLVGAIDPSAFTDGVPNPNDLLGTIVPDLDYALIVYDLPVYFQGTGLEPLINMLVSGFENSMVALDASVDSLLGLG